MLDEEFEESMRKVDLIGERIAIILLFFKFFKLYFRKFSVLHT